MKSKGKQSFWRKLNSSWLTRCSLIIILLYTLTAIFAYTLSPDNTTEANEQISENALHRPGSQVKLLEYQKTVETQTQNPISIFLNGKKAQNHYLPIEQYKIVGDSVQIKHYLGINPFTDAKLPAKPETLPVSELKNSLDKNNHLVPQVEIKSYPLGTDGYGRCVLSRTIIGSRISMVVGLLAVLISLVIGITVGLLAGYVGGKTDDFLMLIINTIWSVPTILLVFAIVLAMGRGVQIIYIAVGLTLWVDVARIVRGQVLALKENVYIDAARSLGFGQLRILTKHILPNIMGPIWVVATGNFATAIILEAGLSYLGFGIQPPKPSWGNMLNENYGYALSGNYVLALIPSLAIVILVLCVNIVGNALRDAYDVKID